MREGIECNVIRNTMKVCHALGAQYSCVNFCVVLFILSKRVQAHIIRKQSLTELLSFLWKQLINKNTIE